MSAVEEAVRLAPELGSSEEAVRDHLARLPSRYVELVHPRAIVRHTMMADHPPGPSEVRTRVTPGRGHVPAEVADGPTAVGDLDELDVVAIDHPGWFAKVAGVLALHGGSIVAADAFTRADGLAIDTFRVRAPEGASGSWWARVEGDLVEAAAGKLAIRARVLREARRETERLARLARVPTRVTTAPDTVAGTTVVEVRTLDRIGVLYAIAAALAELELDIVLARVETFGVEAVDIFHVRDVGGEALDTHHTAELELAVTAAIQEL